MSHPIIEMTSPQEAYTPFSGVVVSTTEIPLTEVQTAAALSEALSAVMESALPGFIIRRTGLDGQAIEDNLTLRDIIRENLRTIGYLFEDGVTLLDFSDKLDIGLGRLHADSRSGDSVDSLDIHTTISGTGAVLLVDSGPAASGAIYKRAYEHMLNKSLLSGETDPTILQPLLHTAALATGDSVVFPLANAQGPVWHRFDTIMVPRSANISELDR